MTNPLDTCTRARRYLAKLPPAIAGQGGHGATFAAACRLREFGLSEADALAALSEWNLAHCEPHWTEPDLRHKLADAFRVTSPKREFAESPGNHVPTSACPPRQQAEIPRVSTADVLKTSLISNPSASLFDAETSKTYFSRLAALRSLSTAGVRLAYERGLLRFGMFRTRPAWFITDGSGRVTQARRLDGQLWPKRDDKGFKSWTIIKDLGDGRWPVGIGEARDFATLALCEGSPDLLAAFGFLLAENRERDVAPVTMFGGCARIHADALPLFAGKRVRIFPHVDDTGERAVSRWAEQLAATGATVDAFSFAGLRRTDGEPVKDLCDLAAIHADDFEEHRCLWSIFP